MAKTKFNVEQFKTEAVKPLYAVAGAAEMAVVYARGYADEAQKRAQARIKDVQDAVAKVATIDRDPKALQGRAVTLVNARVEELQGEAREAQKKFEARLKELQKDAKAVPGRFEAGVNEALAELLGTYADLTARGEKFVAAIRKDGVRAVGAVKSAPAKSSTRRSVVATEAAQTANRGPATKSTAKKAPAKKSTTRKTTAAKKASAKKTPAAAKKSAAQKSTTSKNSASTATA
jgi:hypothetical protein